MLSDLPVERDSVVRVPVWTHALAAADEGVQPGAGPARAGAAAGRVLPRAAVLGRRRAAGAQGMSIVTQSKLPLILLSYEYSNTPRFPG